MSSLPTHPLAVVLMTTELGMWEARRTDSSCGFSPLLLPFCKPSGAPTPLPRKLQAGLQISVQEKLRLPGLVSVEPLEEIQEFRYRAQDAVTFNLGLFEFPVSPLGFSCPTLKA